MRIIRQYHSIVSKTELIEVLTERISHHFGASSEALKELEEIVRLTLTSQESHAVRNAKNE